MAEIVLEEVLPILKSFVETMRTDPSPSSTDRLSDMGLDSLTIINVIVTAAETLSLDLEKLAEMTKAPTTIGDVVSILNRLGDASRISSLMSTALAPG
jgi:hypothetical protein